MRKIAYIALGLLLTSTATTGCFISHKEVKETPSKTTIERKSSVEVEPAEEVHKRTTVETTY